MMITKRSMATGQEHTLDIPCTPEQIAKWRAGTLIQNAMPELTPDQREFLISGITREEWDAMFAGREDE